MRGSRKGPRYINIRSKPDEEHTLAALRHPVVCRIQEPPDHSVPQIGFCSLRFDPLQARKMIRPILIPATNDVRIAELEHNVAEVLGKSLTGQTFHILKNKHFRFCFPDHPRCLGKEVTSVCHRAMLASDGERLARRTAGNKIDPAFPAREILAMNVTFDQRPVPNEFVASSLVGADCLTGIVVELEHSIVTKPGI